MCLTGKNNDRNNKNQFSVSNNNTLVRSPQNNMYSNNDKVYKPNLASERPKIKQFANPIFDKNVI